MIKINRLINSPIISDKLLKYFNVFNKMQVEEVYQPYSDPFSSDENVTKLINCFHTILKAKFAAPKCRKVDYKIVEVLAQSSTDDIEKALLSQVYKLLVKIKRGERHELNLKTTSFSLNRNFKLDTIEEILKDSHPEELSLFLGYQKSLDIDNLWELSIKIYEKFYS